MFNSEVQKSIVFCIVIPIIPRFDGNPFEDTDDAKDAEDAEDVEDTDDT